MNDRFTERELALAKSVDLVAVAQRLGFTPKRIGSYYTLDEMDSVRIYNRKNWYRWSAQVGGSQIDFLKEFAGMPVKEAVFWLLDFAGYRRDSKGTEISGLKHQAKEEAEAKSRSPFVLPKQCRDNRMLYRYLEQERGLSRNTIDYFVKKGLIYESEPYHNIVFQGKDKQGVTRFASMRGVYDRRGKPFKCDVAGNDKQYGFNLANEESHVVTVFEAAIDLMSYLDIYQNFHENLLALGMVADLPLARFLEDYPQITEIRFCLDNDDPGRKATKGLMEKYQKLGYLVQDVPAPVMYKDYNEWLVGARQKLQTEKSGDKREIPEKEIRI